MNTTLFLDIIRRMIKSGVDNLAIAVPCIVEKFNTVQTGNTSAQSVDLKFACREHIGQDGEYTEADVIIPSVRVQFPQTSATCFISLPIKKGTPGMLHLCDCDISTWLTTGEIQPVDSDRRHDLNDSYFVPGLMPDKNVGQGISATDMILRNDSMKIEIDPTGKIAITGGTGEMLSLISDYMDKANSMIDLMVNDAFVTPAGAGAHSPATITAWNSIVKAQMTLDKTKLDGITK